MERWATFDCYGTLIDWDGGVRAELVSVFGEAAADAQLARYHEVEVEIQRDGSLPYREVLTETMRRLGAPAGVEHGLVDSLPNWRAFPEVKSSLEELKHRGWRLAILSNTDDDLIAASQVRIGVAFDEVVVAQEIGSYKPGHRHWEEFFSRTRAPREGHVHVAASLFHDIAPGQRAAAAERLDQPARRDGPAERSARPGAARPGAAAGDARRARSGCVSALRARCPSCRTLTAVAVGPEYQCHSCGREFGAGLLRVPRAWGTGGEAMAEAARLELPWPEAAVIAEDTLDAQIAATARELPARPLVLGGCCCSHVGAVRELARRHGRIGVVWIDAHGDLNTPESSPSGNAWGMPLRMLIDAGDVEPSDVTLLGARNLDPPEAAFIAEAGINTELGELPGQALRRSRRRCRRSGGAGRLDAGARRDPARRARSAAGVATDAARRRLQRPQAVRPQRRGPGPLRACARNVTGSARRPV